MLKELFQQKQLYLNHFFEKVDLAAADKFLNHLQKCKGTRILSGIGKSGIIAKKIAVTMSSTGSKALFLSATDALHGDIGIVSPEDVFVILSKSGESQELLDLVPHIRNKGVNVLSIVSNPNSRLSRMSDFSMTLPLAKELCPFNMAPTTSTAIQMIFGDILAVALMRQQNFSIDQYALNHPAGSIGKKATLKVQDLMYKGAQLPICQENDKLNEILKELSEKRCGCILIVNKEMVLQGIFTDGDLRRALLQHGATVFEQPINTLMTKTSRCIGPNALAWQAMQEMEKPGPITSMPVIDEQGKLLGLIRLHDAIQAGIS